MENWRLSTYQNIQPAREVPTRNRMMALVTYQKISCWLHREENGKQCRPNLLYAHGPSQLSNARGLSCLMGWLVIFRAGIR